MCVDDSSWALMTIPGVSSPLIPGGSLHEASQRENKLKPETAADLNSQLSSPQVKEGLFNQMKIVGFRV